MYDIEDFLNAVRKSEGLICYGTGKRFGTFIDCFKNSSVLEKITYCVDRSCNAGAKILEISNKKIHIYGCEKLRELRDKEYVLLITNLRYEDIYDELENDGILEQVQCYCFTHLYGMILENEALQKKIPDNIRITREALIPKVIHYCWFGGNPIPDNYKRWMESWKKYCPDYEIVEWNESNYDIKKNRYMYEAYKAKKWGFVPDYARLDIIYEYGGIYLDTDVELVQSLDDLLYQSGFAGFERKENVALGLGFGAMRHLPIIEEMKEVYANERFLQPDGSLNVVPSPVYQTNYLKEKGLITNGEYQIVDGLTIYPEKMFSGKCPYTRRVRLTSYTRSIHHYDASWADDEWKARNVRFEKEMNG